MEGADFGRPFEPGVNDFREFGGRLENSAGWRVKAGFLLFLFCSSPDSCRSDENLFSPINDISGEEACEDVCVIYIYTVYITCKSLGPQIRPEYPLNLSI